LTSNLTITATYELALAPVASFIFSPAEPIVAETVTFNASASNDPDGTIVSYVWDFGDGDSDNGAMVEHAYTTVGTYNVTLTVSDNDELTRTITKTITVKEAPPSDIPSEIYLIAIGLIAIIIIAIVVYYLKIMKQKPT
jgi:PKD repeat protein